MVRRYMEPGGYVEEIYRALEVKMRRKIEVKSAIIKSLLGNLSSPSV